MVFSSGLRRAQYGRQVNPNIDATLLVEIDQLCARYMMLTSQFIEGRWLEVFTPDGEVLDPSTREFLSTFMSEFHDHLVRVLTVLPRPVPDQ